MFGILDELDNLEEEHEMSVDSIHLGLTNETRYFYVKAKQGIKSRKRGYGRDYGQLKFDESRDEHVKITIKNFNLNAVDAPMTREVILTNFGVLNSERNSAV
jgi:hypothetical protein